MSALAFFSKKELLVIPYDKVLAVTSTDYGAEGGEWAKVSVDGVRDTLHVHPDETKDFLTGLREFFDIQEVIMLGVALDEPKHVRRQKSNTSNERSTHAT